MADLFELDCRDAATFGIEPDTGENMADRIRTFVCEGLNKGVRAFRFKPGRYEIADAKAIQDFEALMAGKGSWDLGDNTEKKNVLICAEGIEERIVLDFQGSTLMCHGLIQPFFFKDCRLVEIRNVVIDWSRPPFSQGRIVSVDEDGFEIECDSEYPIRSGTPVAAINDYVPGKLHPLQASLDWFHVAERTELVGERRLRVTLKERLRERIRKGTEGLTVPTVGMHLVVRHAMNYKAALLFYRCASVELEQVDIFAVPGMGVVGHGCGDVRMRGLRVMRRPGSSRIMSSNTDATHFIGCMGTIEFDDCLFEGMGDDATNVHGFYLSVRDGGGDDTLSCGVDADIQSECPEVPAVGDAIEFTRRSDLQPYATLHVREVETDADGGIALRFREPLPERFSVEDLLANASRIAKLRFRNSIVRNNRARGILVQTRDVEISGNTFDHCTGTAIHVNCADGWKESVSTENVTVTRNEFLSCGFGAGTYRKVSALAVMTESSSAGVGTHRSFTFTDNRVCGNGRVGISLESLDTALVSGNRFEEAGEAVLVDEATCERLVVEE